MHNLINETVIQAEKDSEEIFKSINQKVEVNQKRVLDAFRRNYIGDHHFTASDGYGYDDSGRDNLEAVYADVFGTEDALVRPQIVSGTHAISTALFSILRPNDELLYITGSPYDTLEEVIGKRGNSSGSLKDLGVSYNEVKLTEEGMVDYQAVKEKINEQTKVIGIQRSKGYEDRPSFTVNQIKEIIAGSLIKNPGGGLVRAGGYIAGTEELVLNAANRLTAPGLGKETGATLNMLQEMYQGFFLAPHVVGESLKGAVFAARYMELKGYQVKPVYNEKRTDLIQTIKFENDEKMIKFCQNIQKGSPVNSYVEPYPSEMPGYDEKVIMAAGTFIQGSSIELSVDGPIKPPYIAFLQGGLTYAHVKIAIIETVESIES